MRRSIEPLKDYMFRNLGGRWSEIHDIDLTLADVLSKYELVLDDRTEFARFYDFERNVVFWYRAYTWAKVTLTLWPIDDSKPSNIN